MGSPSPHFLDDLLTYVIPGSAYVRCIAGGFDAVFDLSAELFGQADSIAVPFPARSLAQIFVDALNAGDLQEYLSRVNLAITVVDLEKYESETKQ